MSDLTEQASEQAPHPTSVGETPLDHTPDHGPISQPPSSRSNARSELSRGQKWFVWLGSLCAVVTVVWYLGSGRIAADQPGGASLGGVDGSDVPAGMLVTAEPVSLRPLKRTIEALGSLHGYEEIIVSSNVEGRVLRVLHDVSDRIPPNELIVEIDPADVELEITQLERNLEMELAKLGLKDLSDPNFDLARLPALRLANEKRELTRSKMVRMEDLQSQRAAPAEAVENAISEFKMAEVEYENQMLMARSSIALIKSRQASLEIAYKKLRDTQVKTPTPQRIAPHSGNRPPYVITKRSIAEGSFLRVGDEICRLMIDDTLILRALLPEHYSPDVQVGQDVEVFPSASRNSVKGRLTRINPAVDPSTRTFQVEIEIANEHSLLKPGGFAKGVIELSHDVNARTIPVDAMVQYAGVTKLFVVEAGSAREVRFVPGVQTAEWIEVVEPVLPAEAIVVTSGQFALADGAPIVIRSDVSPTKLVSTRSAASRKN